MSQPVSSVRGINFRVLGAVAVGAAVAVVLWFAVVAPRVDPQSGLVPVVDDLAAAQQAGETGETGEAGDAGAVDGDGPAANAAAGDPNSSPGQAPIELSPPATAEPSPTPLPEPQSFTALIGAPDFEGVFSSPMPGCGLIAGEAPPPLSGAVSLRCIEDWSSVEIVAARAGRIVHVVREPSVDLVAELGIDPADGRFRWAGQAGLGAHVVVDHGPVEGRRSVQTVYAGLDSIGEEIRVGVPVDAGAVLGSVAGPDASMLASLWVENVRQDGVSAVGPGVDTESQRAVAAAVREVAASPTDPRCPVAFGFGVLPGASRQYRNGIHQGIDFGCGTSGRFAHSIAEGTVVYVVDDYVDPTVANREALLANAGLAGFTPHWTLVMLYGNVVIIDHGELADTGTRMVSIAAHLEAVDPAITLGATVESGQVLGEIGNRGTNAAAQGLRGASDPSLHLHWELFFDDWFLGADQQPGVVAELVSTALCGVAATAGCP